MKNTLIKSTTILMAITVISKLFGFGREVAQAYFFGADIYTDAYLVAMTIPTVLFLAVSSAINNVFIPVYDRFKAEGRDKALVFKFTQIGLVLVTVIFIIPVFLNTSLAIRIFAPAFPEEAIVLAAAMLRILIMVIFFRLLSSIATAVLHVNRNFIIPGLMGIPYSLAIMAFSFLFHKQLGINALIWGTFIGIVFQFLMMLPWLAKTKMGGNLQNQVSDGLKEIAFLLPPVLLGTMAGSAKAMIDRMFASGLEEGSISYLNYAIRLRDLPVGLLVVAVVTVLYPTIVTHANNKEWQQYRSTLAGALNTMTFLMLPMMAGFIVLALPITQLVYQRGSFDTLASMETAKALLWYSPGLMGIVLYQLLIKGFYAVRDTKTPLVAMLIMVGANIILNFALIGVMGHAGLALATSISTIIGGVFMLNRLSKVTGTLMDKRTLADMAKSLGSTIVMALFCLAAYTVATPYIPESFMGRVIIIGSIIAVGAGIYFALAMVLKISAMQEAVTLLTRLKNRFTKKAA